MKQTNMIKENELLEQIAKLKQQLIDLKSKFEWEGWFYENSISKQDYWVLTDDDMAIKVDFITKELDKIIKEIK